MSDARCPICESESSIIIDERPVVPIAQNLMFDTQESAISCPTGALEIRLCRSCSFVWNARFDPKLLVYNASYENDQTFSPAFDRHVESVLDHVEAHLPATGMGVVEVGCGQGYFIQRMRNRFGDRLTQIFGFDPAYHGAAAPADNIRIFQEYFGKESMAKVECDPALVISRHTIEHVEDPMTFLKAIRAPLAEGTIVAIETPDVRWILERGVAQDMFYEHCSLFNPTSMSVALALSGFELIETHLLFEDQYMLTIARAAATPPPVELPDAVDDLGYKRLKDGFLTQFAEQLRTDIATGRSVAFWGGASKGVTLALLIDRDETPIECAIDVNPRRQGRFMPISGLPVVSPATAREAGIDVAYVMNPIYTGEIALDCQQNGWDVAIRDI